MSKYFSYDAIDVNLYVHDTAEEAKQSALDIAEDGYNLSSDQCDGLSKGSQDLIKSICYGVILGGIDLPVRQTSVEQDGADAVAKFKYMAQPPVIVEYEQNNGWIKCSDRLPKPNTRVLICNRDKEVGCALYQELIGFGYIPLSTPTRRFIINEIIKALCYHIQKF